MLFFWNLICYSSTAVPSSYSKTNQKTTNHQTLVISRGSAAPDCFSTSVMLINNSFSGPVLNLQRNSFLSLTIINNLDEPFSMHLHGIDQVNTPWADGATGISNTAIQAGSTHTSKTFLDKAGTFLYHAHIKLQDMHVYGALIVHESELDEKNILSYDDERVLVIADYWRANLDTLFYNLIDAPTFQFVGLPQAFLTNGQTSGSNCTDGVKTSYHVTTVTSGKSYRLRLIGATTLFATHFSIQNHTLTIVEVEGSLVEPIRVDYLMLLPGQRYSVIISADQPIGDYYMQIEGKWRAGGPKNGFSILRYENQSTTSIESTEPLIIQSTTLNQSTEPLLIQSTTLNQSTEPLLVQSNTSNQSIEPVLIQSAKETAGWIDSEFQPLKSRPQIKVPPAQSDPIIFRGKQINPPNSTTQIRWALNDISYSTPTNDSILSIAMRGELKTLSNDTSPFLFQINQVVDIVFQNQVAKNGVCEVHPWHIHGHSAWMISQGPGKYDPAVPDWPHPIKRDVISLYPYSAAYNQDKGIEGSECGWSKIRFVASNVGAWALHCHIISHFAMGMGTSFVVGPTELADPGFIDMLANQSIDSYGSISSFGHRSIDLRSSFLTLISLLAVIF